MEKITVKATLFGVDNAKGFKYDKETITEALNKYVENCDGSGIIYEEQFSHANNEKDEVGDIAFININDVDNYQWAFNHVRLMALAISKYWTNFMNDRWKSLQK